MFANPFVTEGHWFKANLHTHTTNSDGDRPPAERVQQYCDAGYAVLALTDHGMVTPVDDLGGDGMLLLPSAELHPPCEGPGYLYHLVCLNLPPSFGCDCSGDANELVRRVRESGGEVIYGHPYWCGHDVQDIVHLDDLIGLEVFNSTCTKIGKGDSSVIWDYLLDAGCMLPALAVDDVHTGRDIFMGWTMIKAPELSVKAVMQALRTGCYYASSGPVLEDFRVGEGTAVVACSPCVEIHFKSNRSRGRSFYNDGGDELTAASFAVPRGATYVRAEIVDAKGRRAWSNPIAV